MKKKVVVGLSGGVDSSVAAHLLIEEGYDVIGLFMKNWHDESATISNECPWIDDSNDALLVAQKLGIPFQTVDLSKEYKERIVEYMFREYESGRTPNPDVLCNREIKFDVFLDIALKLGADYVATGHYCRKTTSDINGKKTHHLLAGLDNNKDQSYFLCQLNQQQLSKALFPIGDLQKSEVRAIAKELDLITADKKDSQGLCFVGKIKLPDFLQQQLNPKKGKVYEVIDSEVDYLIQNNTVNNYSSIDFNQLKNKEIGTHNGAHFYTVGQRKGLGIGGYTEPLFVVGTDTQLNNVYVAEGTNHPALLRTGLTVKDNDIHWVREDLKLTIGESKEYLCRIRYRQPLDKAVLTQTENGLLAHFEVPQKGIAKGQFLAWYSNEGELIGSGVID